MRVHGLLTRLTGATVASLTALLSPALMAGELTLSEVVIPSAYELDATLEAVNAGTISAQTSGVIRAVHGDVNDKVSKGDLLIEIDSTQQRAAVAQAEAALAQANAMNDDAQTLLRRNTRLQKQGTLSEGEYDRSVAQAKSSAANVKAAEAALTQAREQLSYTQVTAPYAGIISQRFIEVGELVNPGQALMSGYSSKQMRAITDLPQRLASKYSDAQQLHILVGDQSYPATDVVLFPYADPERHSVRLRASLSEDASQGLMPGQWVKVQMHSGERQGVAVPGAAILRRGEMTGVYVRLGNKFIMRQVRLGNRFSLGGEIYYEVLAGLNAGDVIADNALSSLAQTSEPGE